MKLISLMAALAALPFAACGGGSSSGLLPDSPDERPPSLPVVEPVVYPPLPQQTTALAAQAPIVDLGGTLHVGADVTPPRGSLMRGPSFRGVTGSVGPVSDGIGRDQLISYLRHDASMYAHEFDPDGYIPRFGGAPPVMRVAEGTPPNLTDIAVHAVQLINASLPYDWQFQFSDTHRPAASDDIAEGEILIVFASHADWPARIAAPGEACAEGAGCAEWNWTTTPSLRITGGRVWIDPAVLPGIHLQSATVHEIIHLLGRQHADPERFLSIMASSRVPGHMLHPLDREALLAVYGWLDASPALPGDLTTTFGSWTDTSLHIRGDIDAVEGAAFGVAKRNGLAQPWARGPTPHTNLADNEVLAGTVSWSGLLMGVGDQTVVGGDADLSVELSTLRGELEFTNLEYWSRPTDVSPGTGSTWGDGDLEYFVKVRGNTFVQTGGDEGIVTGAFFGASHEAMGGTLKRGDLAAAFGGNR